MENQNIQSPQDLIVFPLLYIYVRAKTIAAKCSRLLMPAVFMFIEWWSDSCSISVRFNFLVNTAVTD